MIKPRTAVAALAVLASTIVSIGTFEGWEGTAKPPLPGDHVTGGYGTTVDENRKPLKMGQKIDPVRGLILLGRDVEDAARMVRKCAPYPMYQHEFQAFVMLAQNIGHGAGGVKDGFCVNKEGRTAIIPRRLNAGDYKGACEAILLYGNFKGKPLRGLAIRRQAEYRQCTGAI